MVNGADVISSDPKEAGNSKVIIEPFQNKEVVLQFERPMHYLVLEPVNAANIGKRIIDCAVLCGARVKIETPRKHVSKDQRDLLVTSDHVYRSMVEKHRAPKDIAREVVDTILSAID